MTRAGTLVTAVFALAWALTGASGVGHPGAAVALGVAAVVVTVLAVVAGARVKEAPTPVPAGRGMPADWRRRFDVIGGVQLGTITLVVVLAVAAGVPGLVPAAVCLVVGGHFFPLATVVVQPQYRLTGAALCATAAAGAVAFAASGDATSAVVVGVGAAVALWATSLHLSLARGRRHG